MLRVKALAKAVNGWSDAGRDSYATGESMQAVKCWIAIQLKFRPARGLTHGVLLAALASNGIVLSPQLSAEDKFIIQPKRVVKTAEATELQATRPPQIPPPSFQSTGQSTGDTLANQVANQGHSSQNLPGQNLPGTQPNDWGPTNGDTDTNGGDTNGDTARRGDAGTQFGLAASDNAGLRWTKRDAIHSRVPAEFPHAQLGVQPALNATDAATLHRERIHPINDAIQEVLELELPSPTPFLSASGDFGKVSDWEELSSPLVGQDAPYPLVRSQSMSTQLLGQSPSSGSPPHFQLASKVSRQIIGDWDQTEKHPVVPIHLAAGWDSIGRQLTGHLRQSEKLASRGVVLSAREECQHALLILARHLDHLTNSFASEPGMHAAQTALRESADFTDYLLTAEDGVLKQIVHSHETPLLKHANLRQASPLTLAEHYRRYAERQIVQASQHHPWFSDILYHLGRTYQAEADISPSHKSDHLRGLALAYYRAAWTITPSNALAANQIGFVLLQQDRPKEAQQFLIASVDAKLDAPALQNLAEASRRLGDTAMEQWSLRTLASAASGNPPPNQVPPVQLIDNATFVTVSPMTSGPQNVHQQPGVFQTHQHAGVPTAATAKAPASPSVIR